MGSAWTRPAVPAIVAVAVVPVAVAGRAIVRAAAVVVLLAACQGVQDAELFQVGENPQLVHPAFDPGLAQFPGACGQHLAGGQRGRRGKLAARDHRVPRIFRHDLHPPLFRRVLPAADRGLGIDLDDRTGDPVPDHPPGHLLDPLVAEQDRLGRPCLGGVQRGAAQRDDVRLVHADDPVPQCRQRGGQLDGQVVGQVEQLVGGGCGQVQLQGQLAGGVLVPDRRHPPCKLEPAARLRTAADELRHGHQQLPRLPALQPLPRPHQPQQLIVSHGGERPVLTRCLISQAGQRRAWRRLIQRAPLPECRSHAGEDTGYGRVPPAVRVPVYARREQPGHHRRMLLAGRQGLSGHLRDGDIRLGPVIGIEVERLIFIRRFLIIPGGLRGAEPLPLRVIHPVRRHAACLAAPIICAVPALRGWSRPLAPGGILVPSGSGAGRWPMSILLGNGFSKITNPRTICRTLYR